MGNLVLLGIGKDIISLFNKNQRGPKSTFVIYPNNSLVDHETQIQLRSQLFCIYNISVFIFLKCALFDLTNKIGTQLGLQHKKRQ